MKEITRKTNVEMVEELKNMNKIKDKERVLDSYTYYDPELEGQFITVITVEDDHVYFKTTYFYNYELEEYHFVTVNGCM